ncbi:hypothetical protein CDLVIII_1314 [Clostridium sp. DL-VIII]|uniref:rolling circle replication-associated protein n=1 Tax=Clostridium sp. DL-VIII TaxID=641107 RepID=UPI00023AF7B1|nr:hypothetical protein [Clostridium sp. DL-VIII]EHI98013.1 hypothetical protein CDLVIII_1314 [Clostridium sp. DL-VIII]
MPYVKREVKAGVTIEIKKYFTSKYKAKGMKRGERVGITTEEQEKINQRHAEDKLRWKMNANFVDGDYHTVFDYNSENKPDGKEEMRKDMSDCLKQLRKECKKLGMELKYIHVMEIGQKGARHHHLVINEIPIKILRKCWTKGRIHVTPLNTNGQYKKLANYFIKYSSTTKELQRKRYYSSKNLIIPEPDIEIVASNKYLEEPKPIKGYYVEKESIYSDMDQYTGYKYLTYTLIKIPERGGIIC